LLCIVPKEGGRTPMPIQKRCLAALALALTPAPALAASQAFRVGPPGAWVRPCEVPASTSPAAAESTGTRYLLFDRQVRVGAADEEDYVRSVWKVETTAGLQDASEITISFDPTFERLVIHHANVQRDGHTAWRFSPGEVRVIEAEEDLEARLYNGELTATIFVKGLRVGDTVDYAFTLEGTNPVLGGRFDTVLAFGYAEPVARIRRRIVWQRETPLHLNPRGKVPTPTVTRRQGETTYEWESRDSPAVATEERTPSWFVTYGRVEASDFASWADVARSSRDLFASAFGEAPSLDALVRSWKLSGATEDARIDRAVRFVQDEVRYLGLEMGRNSHQPHPPAETLERRFGDCKDKSALLVAILRRLGVKAWPALVSTRARQGLDDRLPALFAFDHVIVALQSGRDVLYVDATASEQGGPVRSRHPPPYARALVLDGTSRALTEMPYTPPPTPTVEVAETFAQPRWDAPVRLDVVTTYTGEEADGMRQSRARSTRDELGRTYREFYAQEHAGIRALELPRIADDRDRNVLVVREAYEIPALWKRGAHDFRAWFIQEKLVRPRTLERSRPLALSHPDHVRQVVTIRLPGPPELAPLRETIESPAFVVDASWAVHGNEARLQYTYRSLRGTLQPKDLPELVDRIDRAADLVVCRVGAGRRLAAAPADTATSPERTGRPVGPVASVAVAPRDEASGRWLAMLLAGGCVLGLFVWGTRATVSGWQARQRRSAFRASTTARTGESPGTAIAVDSLELVAGEGAGGACSCGGPWRETERASLLYDGGPLTVVTRRCDACEAERTLYFRRA
jgi:transglutaminase-like putative cysteine protease